MRNIFITFYENLIDPIQKKDRFVIFNGFSFGREMVEGEIIDIFIDTNNSSPLSIAEEIEKYDNINHIFCSCHFNEHFRLIESIVDERWVIGGAISAAYSSFNSLSQDLNKQIIGTTWERYLGQQLSSTFFYYFEDLVKKLATNEIYYACRLGFGCYWGKCKFCDFFQYDCTVEMRPHPGTIISQLRPIDGYVSTIHTCMSALPPKVLKDVLAAPLGDDLILHSFIRADSSTIKIIRNLKKDLNQKYLFTIGVEAFSQILVDRFQKGIKINNVLEVIEELLMKNGKVRLTILDDFAYINGEIVDEYIDALDKLSKILNKYSRKIEIHNDSSIVWVSEERARNFADNIPLKKLTSSEEYVANFGFKHMIANGTEEYKLNKLISNKYQEIDFRMLGKWKYIEQS